MSSFRMEIIVWPASMVAVPMPVLYSHGQKYRESNQRIKDVFEDSKYTGPAELQTNEGIYPSRESTKPRKRE